MENKEIIIDGVDVSGCEYYDEERPTLTCTCEEYPCSECPNCHYKQLARKTAECEELKEQFKLAEPLYQSCNIKDKKIKNYEQTLAEIKEIAEPYKMLIKKICGNCKKYDDCHACCYKDINCYKYTSSKTNACEEFTYSDEFVPNILANNILQKISEVINDR